MLGYSIQNDHIKCSTLKGDGLGRFKDDVVTVLKAPMYQVKKRTKLLT